MKSLFLFFILFGGWSVEGSVGVVRGPVRSGGQCFWVTLNNKDDRVLMSYNFKSDSCALEI